MKFTLKTVFTVLFILSAGILVAWASNDKSVEKVKVGDVAPDFTVITPDGELTTADLKGKVVLINLFATWCPPCRKELPVLEKQVWEKYKGNDDFVLLVIGREHTSEELLKFAADQKMDLPFYPDSKREIFNQFAIQSIPRNYIINKDGKIVYASKGFSNIEFKHMLDVLKRQL